MRSFSVAQAKAQLSALLDVVEAGEDVEITRRGRAAATSQPMHDGPAADTFIENLREQARF